MTTSGATKHINKSKTPIAINDSIIGLLISLKFFSDNFLYVHGTNVLVNASLKTIIINAKLLASEKIPDAFPPA